MYTVLPLLDCNAVSNSSHKPQQATRVGPARLKHRTLHPFPAPYTTHETLRTEGKLANLAFSTCQSRFPLRAPSGTGISAEYSLPHQLSAKRPCHDLKFLTLHVCLQNILSHKAESAGYLRTPLCDAGTPQHYGLVHHVPAWASFQVPEQSLCMAQLLHSLSRLFLQRQIC